MRALIPLLVCLPLTLFTNSCKRPDSVTQTSDSQEADKQDSPSPAAEERGEDKPSPVPSETDTQGPEETNPPEAQTQEAKEPTPPSPQDLEARAEADQLRKKRAAGLFGKVINPLTKASEAYQEHDSLDKSSWFGKDQGDNQERINELLDEAIKMLGISEVEETRSKIRDLELKNEQLVEQMVSDREKRLSAPSQEELNRVQKTYTTFKEELDQRIADSEKAVEQNKKQILDLQVQFVRQMRGIGVELDLESAQSLLSTVTGDDFVQMCVVFDNVRGVTMQLQELTEQSGESLDAAKRYYGSYVVLIRLLDHVQKDFVRRAREEMVPKLSSFADRAEELILEAHENMQKGGDTTIGSQNVRSNELTIQATELYTQYLLEQAAEIERRNEELQVSLRDAENTYDTVALSSEVANLLREGSRNFAALLRLELPELRGFENAELKAEFERLTEKMNRIN